MPDALRELLFLLGFAIVAIVLGRAAWLWWKRHAAEIAKVGLFGAFGFALAGWLTVALIERLSHVSSENFIWILMWPAMLAMGFAAAALGVGGTCLGAVVALSARAQPGPRGTLLIACGLAAVLLNLWHILHLVRLLLTG
jgi:hypothetical protein